MHVCRLYCLRTDKSRHGIDENRNPLCTITVARDKRLGSLLKEAMKDDPLHPVFNYGVFFGSTKRYPADFGKVCSLPPHAWHDC
jgi:hypothetical protein